MSEDNLYCYYCTKKLYIEDKNNGNGINLNELAKLGWIIEDYGIFCSKDCHDSYVSEQRVNKQDSCQEYSFRGTRHIGKDSLVFDDTYVGFPSRMNILRNTFGKEAKYGDVIVGLSAIIRPGTVIYEDVIIGDNFECGHNVLIRENTRIGNNVRVGTNSVIEGDVEIGNDVNIQSFVYIPKFTQIGNNVFIAPRVTITNDKYPPSSSLLGATIEDDVIICANSTLLPGIIVSERSIIAAGALVTRDVPSFSMAIGSPAKMVKLPEEYKKRWVD